MNIYRTTDFRRVKRRLLPFLMVIGLVAFTAGPIGAESATVTVNAGSLSATTAAIGFTAVTLDGTDQTSTATPTWTATDARGSGLGWNVTVISTDLTGGTPTRTIDISEADQNLTVQLTSGNITVTAGNSAPTTSVGSATNVPFTGGSALKILSAAVDEGMGTYSLVPTFTIEVPAGENAVAYTGTVTVTIASTP